MGQLIYRRPRRRLRQLLDMAASDTARENRMQERIPERPASTLTNTTTVREFSRILTKARMPAAAIGKAGLPVVGKMIEVIADAAASLLAPTLTPHQIYEGDRAKGRREAEADRGNRLFENYR